MPAALKSIPDADKKKILAWCDTHECEHPDKDLNAGRVQEADAGDVPRSSTTPG